MFVGVPVGGSQSPRPEVSVYWKLSPSRFVHCGIQLSRYFWNSPALKRPG